MQPKIDDAEYSPEQRIILALSDALTEALDENRRLREAMDNVADRIDAFVQVEKLWNH